MSRVVRGAKMVRWRKVVRHVWCELWSSGEGDKGRAMACKGVVIRLDRSLVLHSGLGVQAYR